MKIGVLANPRKIEKAIVEKVLDLLKTAGYSPSVFTSNVQISDVDVVIVLGGDGAILHTAVLAAQKKIKVIGVNCGNLGFLAEFEREELEKLVDLLKGLENNQSRVFNRSLLELSLDDKKYYALNEICVQRDYAYHAQLVKTDVRVNGEYMDRFAGDGVLISTPTGSTAYALSAGGAILTPELPVVMLTPVCVFSLNGRPAVFSDADAFEVEIVGGRAVLVVDGRPVATLASGEKVKIRKADFAAEFPSRGEHGFFKKLRTKIYK